MNNLEMQYYRRIQRMTREELEAVRRNLKMSDIASDESIRYAVEQFVADGGDIEDLFD